MKNTAHKFIKYPLYIPPPSRLEKLMVKLHFGGIARCTVCGSMTLLIVKGENLRETLICIRCRSTNRQRQLAYVCCQAVSLAKGKQFASLGDFPKLNNFSVYNTEAQGAIHHQLAKMKTYTCSEYFGESYKKGDLINNIMHQDLMDLALNDESFDLVLSSDVFEHVPDPYKAHKEIYRVLRKGGRHIFTVPFYQTEFLDEDRSIIDDKGNILFLKEPFYHADPLRPEGALVYKIFSLEMLIKLRRIGFRTNLYHLFKPAYGIFGPNAIVFEAVKEY